MKWQHLSWNSSDKHKLHGEGKGQVMKRHKNQHKFMTCVSLSKVGMLKMNVSNVELDVMW